MLDALWQLVTFDIGIDLGTANTLVYIKGRGVVLREPTVVAQHAKSKTTVAVGRAAKEMIGKAPPNIRTIRPIANGVIADFEATQSLLQHIFTQVHQTAGQWHRLPRPRVVIGVPALVTEVERRAVLDAALKSGARSAYLIDESMASALGSGLLDGHAKGKLLIDIGGGTTEIAVVSLDGLVVNRSVPVAGWEMDQAIVNYAKTKHQLIIGDQMAETIKMEVGRAYAGSLENRQGMLRGRDAVSGLPKAVRVQSHEIQEALEPILQQLTQLTTELLEDTPPDLAADITQTGLTLAGGGALLEGIDQYFTEKLNMPVTLAEDPLTAVVRGTANLLDNQALLEQLAMPGGIKYK